MIKLKYNEFMQEHYYTVTPMNRFKIATKNQDLVNDNTAYNIGDSMVYIWNPKNIITTNYLSHRKYICALYVKSGEVTISIADRKTGTVINPYCDLNDEEHLTSNDAQQVNLIAGEVLIINLSDAYRIEKTSGEFVLGRISKDGGVK